MSGGTLRAAIDIGGTFTDLVTLDPQTGLLGEAKSSTTPADFTDGVKEALAVGQVDPKEIDYLVHGTTVVINAITQRAGVRTALVTTKGFRDALEIRRGNRPDMYNLKFHKPEPFVPRRLRFEVTERVTSTGEVLAPLEQSGLEKVAASCREQEVEAIAICFLHAYAHPAHEQSAQRILADLLPEVSITCSSDITQEWREFERSSTAVLNAYVQPILEAYLKQFDSRIPSDSGQSGRFVMLSNGGTATFELAAQQPIQLVESGPAGGVIGASLIGRQANDKNVISLDIGGTTAKCSLISDGEIAISGDYRLEWTPLSPGYPVRIPVVDIVEIGAGGGSIVWFDEGGALRIGPRSAGALPGPACYGAGGTEPTITDAMLLAGVLSPATFLRGRMPLSNELASSAFGPIASHLNLSLEDAVDGVLRLFHQLTVDALKMISVRRGFDPRDFALVAFGGGGPVHASVLAEELGIGKVIVPPVPGTFSAWGMLHSDPRTDLTRTRVSRLDEQSSKLIDVTFSELEQEAQRQFRSQRLLDKGDVVSMRALDMRYHGQEHTVRVPVESGQVDVGRLVQTFNDLHKKAYTFALEQTPIELVNYRSTSIVKLSATVSERQGIRTACNASQPFANRRVRFGGWEASETPIFARSSLPIGFSSIGPAIVEEESATTVAGHGQRFEIDRFGNLVIWTRIA
jgi:N-methylhydantoinase A